MNNYLCIDIGGTAIKYGVYSYEGQLITPPESLATEAQVPNFDMVKRLETIVNMVLSRQEIAGICLSSAGVVDTETGQIVYAGYTIPNYQGTELKKRLEERYGIPCEVENDVNAACLGEYWQGAGQGSQSLVCLTVGTGIGGAILLDGKLHHGLGNRGAELGYMLVNGRYFQDLASTTALVTNLRNKLGESAPINGREVMERVMAGDPECTTAVAEMITHLATGIANIIYVLSPEKIILGGGIMAQKDYFHDRIMTSLKKQMIAPEFLETEIVYAQTENQAGMLGALYHFRQKH